MREKKIALKIQSKMLSHCFLQYLKKGLIKVLKVSTIKCFDTYQKLLCRIFLKGISFFPFCFGK